METTYKFTPGSAPLSHNTRKDFPHQQYFGAANPTQLPPTLGRKVFNLVNQIYTSWCTACNTSTASAYIEGVEMSFEWQAAKEGQFIGAPINSGADPVKAMQTMIVWGSLPRTQAPLSLVQNGLAAGDWNKWPIGLDLAGAQYEKTSFFRTDTGAHDKYDNIKTAMFQAEQDAIAEAAATGQPKKIYVTMAFSQWWPQWLGDTVNPDGTYTATGTPKIVTYVPPVKKFSGLRALLSSIFPSFFGGEDWHAYLFIDWKTINGVEYLVAQNSYGPEYGDGGVQYFPREVVNATFSDPRAGCYMFRDADPHTVKGWLEQQDSFVDAFPGLRQLLGL